MSKPSTFVPFYLSANLNILPLDTTWQIGSSAARVAKMWAEDFDVNTLTIGSLVSGQIIIDITDPEAFLVRKDADAGDIFNIDTTNSSVEIRTADLVFENGLAVTAARYSITRNADATNLLQLNVPTG